MPTKRPPLGTVFLFLFEALGCEGRPEVPSQLRAQSLRVGSGNVAASPDGPKISVCWDSDALKWWDYRRSLVRQAVETTWAREGPKLFTEWLDCDTGSFDVHIGNSNGSRPFTYWSPAFPGVHDGGWQVNLRYDQSDRTLVNTTVHEFGHVFGFGHEQNRLDTPLRYIDGDPSNGECEQGHDEMFVSVSYFGDWDIDSVMNYCNPRNDAVLSGWDVAGFQHHHGRHNDGALVRTLEGRCVHADNETSGQYVEGQACVRKDNGILAQAYLPQYRQRWQLQWGHFRFARIDSSSLCLSSDGTRVVQGTCSVSNWNQKWQAFGAGPAQGGYLKGIDGKCVRRGAETGHGWGAHYLVLGPCTGSRDEMFYFDESIEALVDADGYRIDVPNGSTVPGTPLWTWPVTGSDNQRWTRSFGSFKSAVGGLYLATAGGSSADGTPIVTAPLGGSSTAWRAFAGMQLRSYGARCLDLERPNAPHGTSVRLHDCRDSSGQFWIFDPGRGTLRNNNGRCLDVWNGSVQVSDCNLMNGRRWYLDGGRLQMYGQCLQPRYGKPVLDNFLWLQPCNGSAEQDWSFTGTIEQGGKCHPFQGAFLEDFADSNTRAVAT